MNSRLRSVPFLSLYLAAISAVVLNTGRQHWSSKGWFPVAVGLTAAMAIVPLLFLFTRKLLDRSSSDWWRILFFFFCGLAALTGVPFLGREDALLIVGVVVRDFKLFSTVSGWNAEWLDLSVTCKDAASGRAGVNGGIGCPPETPIGYQALNRRWPLRDHWARLYSESRPCPPVRRAVMMAPCSPESKS